MESESSNSLILFILLLFKDMEMALDSNGGFVNPREKNKVVYR